MDLQAQWITLGRPREYLCFYLTFRVNLKFILLGEVSRQHNKVYLRALKSAIWAQKETLGLKGHPRRPIVRPNVLGFYYLCQRARLELSLLSKLSKTHKVQFEAQKKDLQPMQTMAILWRSQTRYCGFYLSYRFHLEQRTKKGPLDPKRGHL